MDSKKIIKALEKHGWIQKRITGSHYHYTHSTKKGIVTVPHPKKDLPIGTIKSIEKQSGIKLVE
jgi:predicted RNA binding protein YcfA (HicA-like mRNA interferase family)